MRLRLVCALLGALALSACTADARLARRELEQVPQPIAQALETARRSSERGKGTAPAALSAVSLDELLKQAQLRSPGLGAAYFRWRAAVAEIGTAVELPMAMLEYFEAIEDRKANIMLDGGKRGVMFTQQITNPGVLVSREKMLAAEARVMAQDFEAMARETRFRTSFAYFDVQALDARAALLAQLVETAKQIEQSMEPMIASGMATQSDLLRMQVERAEMESDLQGLKLRRPALVRKLVAASGVELSPEVRLDSPMVATPARALPGRAELIMAIEESPMLKMEHAKAAVARAKQLEANWMWVPDFVVGAAWMNMGRPMGEGGTWSAVEVRAGITIPWQFHVNKARSDAASANEAAARLVVAQRRLDLLAELDMALFELADAERMVKLLEGEVLPRARMAQDLVRADFSTGKARLTDVLSAQSARLTGEISLINARTEVLKARAMLLALTGKDFAGE